MKDHQLAVFAEGFVLLEGPRWRDGHLWVSDVWDHCIYRIAPDGRREVVAQTQHHPSGLGFLPDGALLAVSMGDRKVLKIVNGELTEHADLSEIATGDANDMVVDSYGRAYVGNLGYDILAGEEPAPATIALVETDGTVRAAGFGSEFPNGMGLIRQEQVLVVAETWAKRIIAYDREADGTLSNRRVYADLGDRSPDGICVDREDGIWVSSFNTSEFVRVLEGGMITDRAACPGRVAVACQLGGDDGQSLFCTTVSGDLDDVRKRRRKAAIELVRVDVPANNNGRSPD